jgi:hypothetical protein
MVPLVARGASLGALILRNKVSGEVGREEEGPDTLLPTGP